MLIETKIVYTLLGFSVLRCLYRNNTFISTNFLFKFTFLEKISILIKQILNQKFYFDIVYSYICIKILFLATYLYLNIDKGFLELVGPTGLTKFFVYSHKIINNLHDGFLFNYLQYMLFGLLSLVNLFILFYT